MAYQMTNVPTLTQAVGPSSGQAALWAVNRVRRFEVMLGQLDDVNDTGRALVRRAFHAAYLDCLAHGHPAAVGFARRAAARVGRA